MQNRKYIYNIKKIALKRDYLFKIQQLHIQALADQHRYDYDTLEHNMYILALKDEIKAVQGEIQSIEADIDSHSIIDFLFND